MARSLIRRPTVRRRRLAAGAAAATLAIALIPVAGGATEASAQQPTMNCPTETHPAITVPRALSNGAPPPGSAPYGIPFTASLAGGYLQLVGPVLTVTLGGPLATHLDGTKTGSIKANACGLVFLPNEAGTINGNPYGAAGNGNEDQYNNNFQFHNFIPVSLSLTGTGAALPIIDGFGSADGGLTATFEKTPATNGGINVDFAGSAKSTAEIDPLELANILAPGGNLLSTLLTDLGPVLGPEVSGLITQIRSLNSHLGGECTLAIGDLRQAGNGHSSAFENDLRANGAGPGNTNVSSVTGLDWADETSPSVLTTGASNLINPTTHQVIKTAYGEPVTGNITGAQAALISVNFPAAKIDPNMPPSPDADNASESPSTLCIPAMASLLNDLIGLPLAAGHNTFYAPGTFAINIPPNG